MSRLYYEKRESSGSKTTGESDQRFKDYLEKVASLIPGEVIAAYLFLISGATIIKNPDVQMICYCVAFAAGLICTPFYLNMVADPGRPKRKHIIISSFGFIVWAYVTTGSMLSGSLKIPYDPGLASFILGLFSLISGMIPLNDKTVVKPQT